MLKEFCKWLSGCRQDGKCTEIINCLSAENDNLRYHESIRKTNAEQELANCKALCAKAANENSRLLAQLKGK